VSDLTIKPVGERIWNTSVLSIKLLYLEYNDFSRFCLIRYLSGVRDSRNWRKCV
jgi:hypothetical protein